MKRYLVAMKLGLLASLYSGTALAETWIQIEAQPTLTTATEAARGYANSFPNVAGFKLEGRWHVIALGPYASDVAADSARQILITQGAIPDDSFLSDGTAYRQAYWPVGGLGAVTPVTPAAPSVAVQRDTQPAAVAVDTPRQETVAEARLSEATLDRAGREELQVALKFAGFYKSAIDGSFGRGTRGAMAAWQAAKGFEATGVLTTSQRDEVVGSYRDIVSSLQLTSLTDDTAGLTITLPLGLVEFDSYNPPFAKYKSKNNSGVEVLLISQTGDEATLGGLYDIMQTLEIVPLEGPRQRKTKSFTLTGTDSSMSSTTEARLRSGHVKGFTLIWPNGDDQRRDMALEAMRTWSATDAVLPDEYGDGAAQDIDLLAGLTIRRADMIGSGFYVNANGHVLTSASLVSQCTQIKLDNHDIATVVATQDGMALLAPEAALSPLAHADFDVRLPRLQSEVSVAGYPFDGRLGAASLNYGVIAEQVGLGGEEDLLRLAMVTATYDSEVGGPVLASSGGVIGMLAPMPNTGRNYPQDVALAYDMEKLSEFLSNNGVTASVSQNDSMSDIALAQYGRDITTLVSCWK